MSAIVCYMGGCCGDLICALIDSNQAELTERGTVSLDPERQKLKKLHLFNNNEEKDSYLSVIAKEYKSIPSHDEQYHNDRGHDFIAVITESMDDALWAAERFKALHYPHVWEEMMSFSGANTIEDYAQQMIDYSNMLKTMTDKTIHLGDIIKGKAIEKLEALGYHDLNQTFYDDWLSTQNIHN